VAGTARAQKQGFELPLEIPKGFVAVGERSHFVTTARVPVRAGSPHSYTPHQDSMGIITPAQLHFMAAHGHTPPDIDPKEHRLMIHGMVDRPLIFTLDDLKRLPSVSRVHFVECAGNSDPTDRTRWVTETVQQTHGMTSCSEWTGVLLSLLLKEAGVQNGASWLVAEGAETGKHTKSIPISKAMEDVIVVYGQNGEPVRPEQGYPLRLVVPGFEGVSNVKWLRRMKLVNEPYMTKSESSGYTTLKRDGTARWFQFELGPKSVITFPASGGRPLSGRGFYEISGLAWAGGGVVRRVEVSTDGGRSWKDAELQSPIHRIAHTRFRLNWTWDGEEAVVMSRCTDEKGQVQPTLAELGRIRGFDMEYFKQTSSRVSHINAIQPWKVNRDGSVHNALFA
jgi:sulfane dehydrogenase subunit SoxC